MLLESIKTVHTDELEAEYADLVEYTKKIVAKINNVFEDANAAVDMLTQPPATPEDGITNDPAMPPPGQVNPEPSATVEDVVSAMDQVMKQMEAAKRGLGLVNKLGDSPSRTKNRSRIMGNMNRIRANVRRIEKMLASME